MLYNLCVYTIVPFLLIVMLPVCLREAWRAKRGLPLTGDNRMELGERPSRRWEKGFAKGLEKAEG